jgi:hypothetical protein
MPRRASVYIGAIGALAVLGVGLSFALPMQPVEWAWWGAAALLLIMVFAEHGAVEIARDTDHSAYVVSIATIPHLVAAVLLPPWLAA